MKSLQNRLAQLFNDSHVTHAPMEKYRSYFFRLVERMRKNRGDDRGDRACGRKLRQNNSRKTRANETGAQQKDRQTVSRQESRMNDWHCVRWGPTLTLASTPTSPSSIVARIRNFRQCQLGVTKILRAIVACIMHTADA